METKISELTVGELLTIIRTESTANPQYVSGITGIAQLFGVSYSTAKRLKASGVLNDAISQTGSVIITDVNKAYELLSRATHGRKPIKKI